MWCDALKIAADDLRKVGLRREEWRFLTIIRIYVLLTLTKNAEVPLFEGPLAQGAKSGPSLAWDWIFKEEFVHVISALARSVQPQVTFAETRLATILADDS